MRDEKQLKAGLEMKKPPAALAGGGLGAAFQLSGSSGFRSRARIGADNSRCSIVSGSSSNHLPE
jgi:hypothetical protein